MAKQPYIPIYPGDWETRTMSLNWHAELAYFKLKCKLLSSNNKGLFQTTIESLSVLFKCINSLDKVRSILTDLIAQRLIVVENIGDDVIKIICPLINKEYRLSIRTEYKQRRINAVVFYNK